MHSPVLKKHMSFCACAKSRDLLKVPKMSYCSRSRRRWFTVLDCKRWAHSLIYGHFSNICSAHAQKRLFINFFVNLDTAVRFADPDFLLECKISAIWRRFPLILHFICSMSAIFLLPVCLTYWRRMYITRVDPNVDNSYLVWSWYDHPFLSYSAFICRYGTWHCDLDLWPFDLEQLSCLAGHVPYFILATKYEDPTHIHSWVMSYDITFPIGYH